MITLEIVGVIIIIIIMIVCYQQSNAIPAALILGFRLVQRVIQT